MQKEIPAGYKEIYSQPYTWNSLLMGLFYFCDLYVLFGLFYLLPGEITCTDLSGLIGDAFYLLPGEIQGIHSLLNSCLGLLSGVCTSYFSPPDMMSFGYCGLSNFFTTTYYDQRGCIVYTKAEYLFNAATRSAEAAPIMPIW